MSYDISEKPEDALDLGPDDRDEPEEHDDDDQEPDGRWCFSTEAGCWIYE